MNYNWGLTSAIHGGKICLEHKEERQLAIMAFSLAFTTLVKSMARLEIVLRDCPVCIQVRMQVLLWHWQKLNQTMGIPDTESLICASLSSLCSFAYLEILFKFQKI